MSQQTGNRLLIDSENFSRKGGSLTRSVAVADLPRLLGGLASSQGTLQYSLEGVLSDRGKPCLHLLVSGTVQLVCQRCLELLDHPVQVDSLLELIANETDLSQEELEDDSRDFIPADKEQDVEDLVEDEVILSLPIAPRHEACALPQGGDVSGKVLPFAALAALKGKAQD